MIDIRISVAPNKADDPRGSERTHRLLRTYLEASGLEQVRPIRDEDPEAGARGLGSTLLGAFEAVLPAAVKAAIPGLAQGLGEFVRRSKRDVKVEIRGNKLEITDASNAEIQRLLDHFVAEATQEGEL